MIFPRSIKIDRFDLLRFQNRRAKWRRQEKAEASTLKINPDFPMSSFPVTSRSSTTASSSSPSCSSALSMDPWLVNPFSNTNTSYCNNSNGSTHPNGIPFFPTNCNVPALYPTPPLHHSYPSFPSDTNELLNETNNNNNNSNNAHSIAHLRFRAKEYMNAIIGSNTSNSKNQLVWPQGV